MKCAIHLKATHSSTIHLKTTHSPKIHLKATHSPKIHPKATYSHTYIYMNLFICFSIKNTLLKLVLAFQIRLVHMAGTT